jgi:hypothetical protein
LDTLEFDSPIKRVIKWIRNIQLRECDKLDNDIIDTFDYIVKLLKSPELYEPELKNTNMESEVKQWLMETANVQNTEKQAISSKNKPVATVGLKQKQAK